MQPSPALDSDRDTDQRVLRRGRTDRRLPESAVFPHGWPGYTVGRIPLGQGETARVVHHAPPPAARTPPRGPAVVCLHGWGASAYGYRHVLGPVAAAGPDAYAPDLRGHGWSSKPLDPAAYTPAALADWTLRLLDALALGRVLLVGHSLGAAVALHTARRAPDRVAALVLLAPLGLYDMPRIQQLRRVTPDATARWLPRVANLRAATALALHTAYGRLGRPSARDVDEYWAPTADAAFARAARLVFHADAWAALTPDQLAVVGQPVEVVVGSRDNLIPADDLRRVHALPRATLDVVPDAGHVLPDEVPDRVLAAIARARAAARD